MKGGGKIEGDRWTTRVKALREGDCIQAQNWSPDDDTENPNEGFWWGGCTMQVLLCSPTGLRDGFVDVYTIELDGTTDRRFCIRADDMVTLVSRETIEVLAKPKKEPNPKKPPKPKKGEQLKLF